MTFSHKVDKYRISPHLDSRLDTHLSRVLSRRQQGFSLLEIAVVLLIVGLMLGGLISPLSSQRHTLKLREVKTQLEEIQTAVLGFAAANGRIPCPTIPNNNGLESGGGAANCTSGGAPFSHGFVPTNSLGLSGPLDAQGLLLDPWGRPIRYSVTRADSGGTGGLWDFIGTGEMSAVGMATLAPDLVVCASASNNGTACSNGDAVASTVPVIFFSTGRDGGSFTSADQLENAGETSSATLGGHSIATDSVFTTHVTSTLAGSEFDDAVVWLSAQILYAHMMQARQLP